MHGNVGDPASMTATEAARGIAAGDLTAEALTTACLERIAECDAEVEAWAHLDPDFALAQARAADEVRATGEGIGPLHGVPVALKDIYDTADLPTEHGTVLDAGRQPLHDAASVQALRDAGAVILGKAVTTELAVFTPGKTRNPIDPTRTPGGSSSGSAAAVGAGMVPLALGTQTAGSVLRPASYCGVYGFKPTFGMISRTGILTQSPSLDTVGIFARAIEDLALAADCLSAVDPQDTHMYPRSRPRLTEIATSEPPVRPTLAFVKTPFWSQAEPDAQEAFGELVEALGEDCDLVDLPDVFAKALEWQQAIQLADIARHYGHYLDKGRDRLSAKLIDMIETGRRITALEYNAALAYRDVLYGGLEQVFQRYDAILTPSSTGPALAGLENTGSPVFCATWTYLGTPSCNLPLLEIDGLPLGVQIVGPRRDDGRLLRTAKWLVETLIADGDA